MTCPARSEEKNTLSLQASYLNGVFLSVDQSVASRSQHFTLTQSLTDVHKPLSKAGDPQDFQKVWGCTCLKCSSLTAADAVPDTVEESGPWCTFGAGDTHQASQSARCRRDNVFLSQSILISRSVILKCFITVVFAAEDLITFSCTQYT